MLSATDEKNLLKLARASIGYGLYHRLPLLPSLQLQPKQLTQEQASFVTLQINNVLRGCIGTLEAHRPLILDICYNAFAAAFQDPRFSPLSAEELEKTDIQISILSHPQDFPVETEEDLLKKLQPKTDGLILVDGAHRSTFLPTVWENLNTPALFLKQLKIKAGLKEDYWSDTIKFFKYTTYCFSE